MMAGYKAQQEYLAKVKETGEVYFPGSTMEFDEILPMLDS
jgi:hypothetical protein